MTTFLLIKLDKAFGHRVAFFCVLVKDNEGTGSETYSCVSPPSIVDPVSCVPPGVPGDPLVNLRMGPGAVNVVASVVVSVVVIPV